MLTRCKNHLYRIDIQDAGYRSTVDNRNSTCTGKKAELSKRWPRDAPYIGYGCHENFWRVPDYAHGYFPGYAHAPFSPKFFMGFYLDGPYECSGQIWSPYSFTRSWDNSDCSFGLGLWTPNLEGSRRGSEMVPLERELVSSYRPSIPHSNFSSIFTRFGDIATFPHPTSSLPKISPCSPGSRWMAFGVRITKM